MIDSNIFKIFYDLKFTYYIFREFLLYFLYTSQELHWFLTHIMKLLSTLNFAGTQTVFKTVVKKSLMAKGHASDKIIRRKGERKREKEREQEKERKGGKEGERETWRKGRRRENILQIKMKGKEQ